MLHCLNHSIWEELTIAYKLNMTGVENGCPVWYRVNSERVRDMRDKGDVTMRG